MTTPRRVGLFAFLLWLAASAAAISLAQGISRITPDFIANWLAGQGIVQGAEVQLCPQGQCAVYRIERLTIETQGETVVVKILPRRF